MGGKEGHAPIPAVRLTMIGRIKSTPKQSFVARD
jgi:hypothetical protein